MNRRLGSPGVVVAIAVVTCTATIGAGPASAYVDRAPVARPGALPVIRGSVGPGFEIWINKESVPAGRYKLVVRDRATIHNFHFFGPGVDRQTSVAGTGRTVWRVTLEPGRYIAACVPHGSMSTWLDVT